MHRASALLALGLVAGPLAFTSTARAAEVTDVASSFEEGNPFDFRFRIRYDNFYKQAQLKREVSALSSTQDAIKDFRDLVYRERRDQLSLRAEVGLFHDLMLHFELPIVLGMTTEYRYDQLNGSNCVFGNGPEADRNCVNASNSTSVRDGIIPAAGFDANKMGGPLSGQGSLVFRGVERGARGGSGADALDTLNIGLTWAPLSQKRDDTKPTWVIAIEGQVSIGTIRKFDRSRPEANHGVSDGTHKINFRTAISRRTKFVEPYVGFWYTLPIARAGSLYTDYGRAQKTKDPQMSAGALFGFEAIPYEHKSKNYKVALDFRGRLEGKFDGRGYSEAFEIFASSPALACDANYNLACDTSKVTNKYQGVPNTGLSVIENHAILGADIGLGAQISKYFQLKAGFSYTWQQAHAITNDDVGKPLQGNGRVTLPEEFNPAYRPVVDQVGRRYRVENASTYNGWVWGQVMF